MFASSVLITAGNPDSMYLEARQEKWLKRKGETNGWRDKWSSRWLGRREVRDEGARQRHQEGINYAGGGGAIGVHTEEEEVGSNSRNSNYCEWRLN